MHSAEVIYSCKPLNGVNLNPHQLPCIHWVFVPFTSNYNHSVLNIMVKTIQLGGTASDVTVAKVAVRRFRCLCLPCLFPRAYILYLKAWLDDDDVRWAFLLHPIQLRTHDRRWSVGETRKTLSRTNEPSLPSRRESKLFPKAQKYSSTVVCKLLWTTAAFASDRPTRRILRAWSVYC